MKRPVYLFRFLLALQVAKRFISASLNSLSCYIPGRPFLRIDCRNPKNSRIILKE